MHNIFGMAAGFLKSQLGVCHCSTMILDGSHSSLYGDVATHVYYFSTITLLVLFPNDYSNPGMALKGQGSG